MGKELYVSDLHGAPVKNLCPRTGVSNSNPFKGRISYQKCSADRTLKKTVSLPTGRSSWDRALKGKYLIKCDYIQSRIKEFGGPD